MDMTATTFFICLAIYIAMVPITLWLGKVFALYCVIMRYWPNRLTIKSNELRDAYNAYSMYAPMELYSLVPIFTVFWPCGIVFMIVGTTFVTIKGVFTRLFSNTGSMRPNWWTWKKLSDILNKGAK